MPDLSKVYKGLQRDAPGYLKDTEEQFVNKWKGKEDKLHDTLSKDVSGFKENVPKDAWYKQAAETKFAGTLVQDISKGNTSDGNAPKTKKATPATHNVVNNAPEPPSFNTDDVVKSSYDIHNEQDNKAPITIKNKFGKDVNKTDIVTAGPKAILENIDNPIDAGKLMAEATNTQVDPAGAIDMWKGMLSDTYDESKKALDTKFGEGTFSTYQDMNKELQDRIESGDKSAEEEYKVFQENSKPLTDSNEFKNFQDISDKVNNAPIQEKLVSTDALSNQFSDVNNLRGNVLNPDSSESKQSTDFVNKGLLDPTKDPLDVGAKLTGTFGLNQLVDDASSDYRSYNMRSNNEAAINAYRQSVQQSLSQLAAETDKVFGAGATDGYLTSKTVREKGLRSLAEKTKTDPTFIPQFTKLYKEYKEFLDKNKDLSESNSFMAMSAYNDGLSKAQKYEDNLDKVFPNSNTYSDWKNNIQAEADKRYAKDYTPVVGASKSLNNYAGRTILRTVASTIESIGALTHSDKLMETAADIKNSVPEASFFNRSGYEHIAKVKEEDFDGNKVTNTYAVDPKTRKAMYGIDKDGNMIPLMQEKNIDKSVELKSEVNPTVYINQAAQVVSDMIPLAALTTATGGITSAALAAGVEGLAGAELASYTASAASKIRWATTTAEFVGAGLQQQPQALQRSLQEGANMDQAYLAQIISGILYGSVSLINPMEAKYAQKLLGAGEGAYSAKLIDKIINGKLTIPQALKHIAKDVSFNIAKENLEETLLEPLSDEVASKAQTLITGQKYQNQLPTLQQTIDTGIITALSTAFFSGVSGDMSRSSIMKNAINTMVADPKEYIKKLELLKQADPANFSDLSESLVKVLGQVEDAGISPKNKQDLALLLIEKAKLVHAQNKADAKGNADILRAQTSDKISELDSAIDKVIELDKKEKESGKKQPGPEKVIVPQEPEVVTPDAKTASTDNPTVDESTSKNNTAVTTPTLSEDGNTLTVPGKNSPQVYTKVEGIWNIETENGSIPMDDNLVSKFITPNLDLAQHPDVSKVETATPSVEDSKKIYTEAVSTQADHLNDEYGVKNDKSTPIITAIGDAIDNGDTSVDELMGVLGKAEAVEEDNDTDTRKARMEILQDGILSIPLQSDVKAVVAKLLKDDKTGSNVIEYLKNILGFHKDNSNHRSIAYGQVESTPASELSKIDKKIRDVKAKKTESEKKLKERQNQKSQTKTVKSAILALEAEIKGHDENLSKLERTKTKFIVDNKLSNSTPSETSDTLDVDKRIGGVQEALSKVNKDLKALRQGKDTETYDAKSLGKKEEPLLNKIADLKAQLKELNDEKKAILNGESTDSTTGNISENVKSSKDEKSSKEKGKKSGTTTNAANDEKGGQSEGLLNENGKAGDSTSATPNTESTTKAENKPTISKEQTEPTTKAVEGVSSNSNEGVNPALKDIESTAKALEEVDENKLSQILSKFETETQNEYIEKQKKEMGNLYSENMLGELKNEYFNNIEQTIKNGGKISLSAYNSLDGGQKYTFDKRYGKSKIGGETLYHSTNKEFDSFDLSKSGTTTDNGWWGKGVYFFKDKKSANDFSLRNKNSVVKTATVNLKNPLVLENESLPKNAIEAFNKRGIKAETIWDIQSYALEDMNKNPERITEILMSLDYDGIHLDLFPNKEVVVFNTSSIDKPINEAISEAYHKAKADDGNPELVEAVEDLLGKKPSTKADTKVSPIDFLPIKKYPKEGDNIVITSPVSKKKITAVFQDGKWWQQTASNNRIVLNDSLTILAQTTFEGGEKQSKAFSQEEHDRLKEVRPEDAKPVSEETKNDKEAIKDSKFKFNKGFSVVYYGQEYHYMGTEITKDGRVYHRFKGPVLAINLFEDSHADILTNISEGKIKASASSDVHTLIDRANEATSANKEYLTENEVNDRASTLQDPKKLSRWNRFWAERRVKAFANKLKKSFPNIEVIFDKKIAEDVYNEHLTQPLRDAEALLTKVNDKLSSYGTIPDAPTKYKNGRVSKQAQQDFDYLTQSHKALTNQKVKLEEQIASLKDTYNTNTGEKKYFRTVTGNVYGYALGNKVYLDPSILSSETAIHEFGHIWVSFAKAHHPELYLKLLDKVKDSGYMKYVDNHPLYSSLEKSGQATRLDSEEEALVTAIGQYGADFFQGNALIDFKRKMSSLFHSLAFDLGIPYKTNNKEIQDLSLKEVATQIADNMVSNDITYKGDRDKIDRQGAHNMDVLNKTPKGSVVYSWSIDLSNVPKAMVVHNTNAMGKYDPILEYEETKSTLDNDSSVKSLLDDYLSKRVAEDKAPEISTILSQPVFQNAGITEEYINNRYEEFKKASPVHAYLGLSEVLGIPTKAKDFVATHQRGSSVNNVNPKAQAVVSSKNDISERANNTTGTKNKFYKVVETIYDSIKKSAQALHIHDSIDSFIRAFDMNGLHPTKALTSNVMYRNGIMHIMDNEGLNQKHSDEVLHKALIAEVSKTPTKFGTILSAIASDPDNFEKYFKDSGFKTQADFTEFLKDVSPSDIKVLLSNPSTLQAFKDLNNLSDETKYEVGKAIHELADQKLGLILDPLSTHLDNMESLSAELSNVAEKAPHIPINQSYELELEEDPTVPQIKAMAGKSTKINKGSEKMDEISTYMAKYPDIPKSYWENILVGMEHEGEPVFTGNAITELVSKANVNSRGNKKSKTSNYSKRTLKLLQEDEQLNNMITSHFNKVMVGQTLTRKHFDEFFLQPTDEDGNKVPIERSEKNRIASITLTGQVQEMLDHDYHSVGQAMETVNLFNNKRHISHSQIIGVGYALNAVKESVDEFRAQIASESHTYTKSGMAGANARMDALVELQGHLFDAFTDMKRLAGQSLVIFQTNIMKSRAEISQEKLDRKLSKVTDEMRNKYPNFEAQIIESHKEMERMEEDIINLRAIDAGSVESQANEGFISAFNNAKQGAKFFDDTAKYDAEVSELIDKLNAIIGGDPSGKVKAQAGYEPAMIIKAMAGGFEADRELNHKSAVIFTLGKLLLQNKRLNINTLEELMDEIKRRKGGNINESEIRVAFALSTPKARTNTIDALKAKVTNVKNQAKLISNLGKLLEGFIMDKTQVTIDVNGVPTTFNSRILNAETQIPVWGIDVMDPSTGAMSFVEATDAQREEIKAEVEKVGIAVEKNGVSKSFIRVIDPANHDRSIWMSKDSNGQMIEASADERELIKKKVKANTSTSNIRGINLTKSVVINSPHSVSGKSENRVFSINNEGRWITLEKIARSESTWRYASDIEELEIHDQLNKVGPFTEIQNTLSNILKCATGLDNIMSNKEIAEFVSAVSDIQHLLPSSLSGITVDDFTIRQMLAKVDAMKALAKVDNIQSQIDAINQKLDIIKEGTDLNAITEMLRKASVPRNTYKSAELRKAEIRLRDAKKRYDSEIQGRLNNRRDALHTAGILMNTFKSLPASMDLSAMGIQGINMIKLGFLSGFGGLETAISKIPGATKFGSAIGIQSRRVRRMRSKMVREGAKVSLQSYGNIEVAENAYEQLRNHPDWPLMMAYGLPLTAPTEHGTDAEELFKEDGIDMLYQETKKHNNKIAKEAGKVLGLAKGLKDKSEASFTSYINSVRASLFLGYLDSYRATGVEPTSDELKRVAQYIGDVTMKSSTILGKDINKSLSALGYVLWAPKMYLANLKMLPNTLIRASQVGTTSLEIMKKKSQIANFDKLITALKTPVGSRTAEEQQLVDKKGNPSIGAITLAREGTKGSILDLQGKRRALKFATSQHLYSLASTVALNGLMYGLLKAICKNKPYWGTDATKSEFLKLGCGNSLRDYTGNTAGYIRMFMQVASKTYKKLGGYDMNGSSFYTLKDAKEVVQQFFVYKMNPALSTPVAVISNEDFMGNKLYDTNQSSDIVAKDILSYSVGNILPLSIKDLFMSGSFLYNLNTFKDDGISPYIGAAGGAIGTVIGWNQKIPYSDDLPTLLKDRAEINPGWDDKKDNPKLDDIQGIMENPTKITMTPALEKLPINFEPLSADYMYFDKKKYGSAGDRNSDDYMYRLDKHMMSASFEPILYNLVKDRDNKKITEEVFKETVKSKLYTIKALTEQHLMNTGYEWGGNLLKATLILEVLKEKNLVPERIQEAMSGITKKGKKSKKSSTDILVSETMQKDLDEAAGYPTSIPESVVSRFTNSTKEQQAIQLEVEKRFKEKMKERGFVKYGAKPKFEKEINLYINPNITNYIGNSLR